VVRQEGLGNFLAGTKDLVRFSVEVSEEGYGRSVVSVLQAMTAAGYRVDRLRNFWNPLGRHNGLNVTVADHAGNIFELQFPTALTGKAGKATHKLYERVRNDHFSPSQRVDALLKIFALNKKHGLSAHQPSDLDALSELNATIDLEDTTFSRWTQKKRRVWTRYLATSEADGVTLDDVLARHNLTRSDVFGPSEGRDA
jgi:hypothetical protein